MKVDESVVQPGTARFNQEQPGTRKVDKTGEGRMKVGGNICSTTCISDATFLVNNRQRIFNSTFDPSYQVGRSVGRVLN